MAEFCVGHQDAVVDHRAADSGAQGGQDDQAVDTLCRAVAHLGDARGIRVIDETDVSSERLLEERLSVEIDPLLRHVRGRHRSPVDDDRGKADADRNRLVDAQLVDDLHDHLDDVVRFAALWGIDLDAIAQQLTVLVSTSAPLMPVPPMSMPTALVMRRP